MKSFTKRQSLSIFLVFLLVPFAATADWKLDAEASELTYLSSKMVRESYKTIFEKNYFSQMSGSINEKEAMLRIDTASVNTNIPIRNDRIIEHIFQSEKYPDAIVKLNTGKEFLDRIKPGLFEIIAIRGTLTLRDIPKPIEGKISLAVTGNRLIIQSAEPILVDALDYGLDGGFETLQELAKLFNIPTTIPVSFSLVFTRI